MMAAQNRTARGRRAPPTSNAQTPMELCKLKKEWSGNKADFRHVASN